MFYRSLAELNRCILQNAHRVPEDVDLIVGLPRSGLLAANLLALNLGLSLADFDGFLEGRKLASGRRVAGLQEQPVTHALVLDDTVATGAQMVKVRERLAAASLPCKVSVGAVYVMPETAHLVDLAFELLDGPRMFEWNLMGHYLLPTSCIDIDGVLCLDPTAEQNDDGEGYRKFLVEAPPLIRPRAELGWLVTSRLEKYRPETERWLAARGIRYRELIMLDLPSKAERQRQRAHGSFKAEVYSRTPASLFIESEDGQAREIARRSGKPVLCIETSRMYYPSVEEQVRAKIARAPRMGLNRARRVGNRLLHRLLRLPSYPSTPSPGMS